MFHNFLQFYAAVVKLADAMDSKSIGLILRAGSTPASGTKSEQFEPFSNFTMVSDCFFFSSTLKNIKIFALNQPKMWKFFFNRAIMES